MIPKVGTPYDPIPAEQLYKKRIGRPTTKLPNEVYHATNIPMSPEAWLDFKAHVKRQGHGQGIGQYLAALALRDMARYASPASSK